MLSNILIGGGIRVTKIKYPTELWEDKYKDNNRNIKYVCEREKQQMDIPQPTKFGTRDTKSIRMRVLNNIKYIGSL